MVCVRIGGINVKRDNRVIFDPVTGKIVFQTGEAEGDINPHEEWNALEYIDVPYGSIDYSKSYIDRIDEEGNPVIISYNISETEEQHRIRELEDALLLQTDLENGGIL